MPIIYPSVKDVTLVGGSSIVEEYIPLWWYSGATASTSATASGTAFFQKGTNAMASVATGTAAKLYTVNPNTPTGAKFALEATIWNAGGASSYMFLWDTTTNASAGVSMISTTATTATVLRSSQFTLIPGRSYALSAYVAGGTATMTDVSLIAFT